MEIQHVLLSVDYTDNTGKFWSDSYIKNKVYPLDRDIHNTVKNAIEHDDVGMELSYNGKPQQNVFIDTKDGDTKLVGYIYRVKTKIDGKQAYFDAWVDIKSVGDYQIELIAIKGENRTINKTMKKYKITVDLIREIEAENEQEAVEMLFDDLALANECIEHYITATETKD